MAFETLKFHVYHLAGRRFYGLVEYGNLYVISSFYSNCKAKKVVYIFQVVKYPKIFLLFTSETDTGQYRSIF